MKTLFLIRHAKSSWSDPSLRDFDRPLNGRGKRDAPRIGAFLRDHKYLPDLMVSSDAKRARITAKKIGKEAGYSKSDIMLTHDLYHASEEEILKVIQSLPIAIDRVFLFGHNPGFTDVANALCGDDIWNLPTCGVYAIRFPQIEDWKEVQFGQGRKLFVKVPKEL